MPFSYTNTSSFNFCNLSKLLLIYFISISQVYAKELSATLTPDKTITGSELIAFPNDDKIRPDKSDFSIIHSVIMSNDKGERWATITIENQSVGRRLLNGRHLMALFADGKRLFPQSVDYDFKSREIMSITVYFGKSKYPILHISTRN
ncbi:hypothetical protein [Aliikangiella sp. IMCC44359]|uniref:hypothetical protein n=1 Tax=Aliikangiella sp. IMCC44359 TaxID=3459125 RepID=UPI00403AFF62